MTIDDLLRQDHINSLPQPLLAVFCGGHGKDYDWPIYDIDIETGLLRIDVSGLLVIKDIGDVMHFVDASGCVHTAESFYSDYIEEA